MTRPHRLLATLSILSLATAGFTTASHAYDVTPVGDPLALGFSPSRLDRIAASQQTQIDAGAFSGAVAAVARNGKVAYLRAVGFYDNARTRPLQSDAIFWIASMSKPITSVAAMMLVEEGKLDLAAPVSDYLPELKDMKVAVEVKDPATGKTDITYEPQKRPMLIEDLLRHTSGIVYEDKGDAAVYRIYRESGLYVEGLARDNTLKDFVSRLARLPLAHQPGQAWDYGHSADVLARIVEVASGEPFNRFLDSRLFKPLGMVDTGFWVPPEKRHRLVDPPAGAAILPDRDVTKPTTMFSGGGGLVSTAYDYLRFCQMLLNGGELDGVRILKPATVKLMTTNALPDGVRSAPVALGWTFGLGFAIRNNAASSWVPGSVGSFTWSGAWGTYFWIDPAEQLIAVELFQATRNFDQLWAPFRNTTYGAFLIPDQGASTPAPAPIDQAALGALEGTYRFGSISSRDLQSEFGGLGIEVAVKEGVLKVTSPIRDMPAAKAGVLSGDVITHLNGEPTQAMDLNQTIEKMRGLANTTIRLTIARKGQDTPIELAIVRGTIRMAGRGADLQVAAKDGKLQIENNGALPVLDFEKGAPITVVPTSREEFFVDGGDHTRLAFLHDEVGKVTGLVLNPGPWQIMGQRANGPG
jgi:CubicO group peptidase (beta-lactamase class C family)